MKKSILLTSFVAFIASIVNAATFTSTVPGGDWNTVSTWTLTSGTDSDGLPDSNDNVIIQNGSTVVVNTTGMASLNITVDLGGTLTFNAINQFDFYGATFTTNGTVNGTFTGINKRINMINYVSYTGTGSFTITGDLFFSRGGQFNVGSTSTIDGNLLIGNTGATGNKVYNYANVTISGVLDGTIASCQWFNCTNAILSLQNTAFPTAGTLVLTGFAQASNNTVIYFGSTNITFIATSFVNLTISGTGIKTLSNTNTANIYGNLQINTGATLQQNTNSEIVLRGNFINDGTFIGSNKLFYIRGQFTNNGTYTAGTTQKMIFDGTTPQAIASTSALSLPYMQVNNATGVTSTADIYIAKTLTLTAGNFTHNGTILSLGLPVTVSAGTLTADAIGNTVITTYSTGNIPATVSGFYNLTIAPGVSNGGKTLSSNTVVLNDLNITSSGSIANGLQTNNFNLTIGGNLTISGSNNSIVCSTNKSITFNGTTATQFINSAYVSPIVFTNLVIDNPNGVAINSGKYKLTDVLTINSGYFDTGNNPFTMTSTATKTARIAPVTGDIYGDFIIERFISARDTTWSTLASPVQATTAQDWDNELFVYYTTNPAQATIFSYDETIADYVPVDNAGTSISSMQGFEVYLTADLNLNNISNITLNSIGNPTYGDLGVFLSYTSGTGYEGENLVGNPFASSISWTDVYNASNDIETYADVFDNVTGNYANVNFGDEIGLGQGFWVYALNTNGFLQILESAKTTSSNSSLRLNKQIIPSLTISSADGSHSFAHTLELTTNAGFDNKKDANDRPYRKSPNNKAPKITSVIDGKDYIRNSFSSENKNYSLPLSVKVGLSGKYEIKAENIDLINTDYSCVVLEDTKLNQFIDLNVHSNYVFFASVADASDRFTLHLSKEGACKSSIGSNIASSIENQVQILPTSNGNSIAFNFAETVNTTVTVTNTLGQSIVEGFSVQANNQTIELGIPSDFSGMYIIKIENEKGVVTKKVVKK